jgi:hypothetical protein
MKNICTTCVKVTTAGGAGAATGSATSGTLVGLLLDIYLDFHASAPATTDTTIAYAGLGGSLLVVTDSATDALIAPRQKLVDKANAAITNSFAMFPLNGPLTVSVAQSDALTDCVTAYIRYLPY